MRIALHSVIREGAIDEYRSHHARVPDELVALFDRAGIHDWVIWRSGDRLFHLVDCDDFDHAMTIVGADLANERWQVGHRAFRRGVPRSGRRHLLHADRASVASRRSAGVGCERMTAVDTHVHIWDPRLLDYPWLRGAGALDAPFLPADYPSASAERVVFVQADCAPPQALDEARWVAGLAPEWPQLAGIVAGADLRSAELEQHLDSLGEIGLVVGVRHLLQGEAIERLSEPALRRGLGALAARGLTFDACIQHPQLGALIDLLDEVPALQVVLDHLGKPPVEEGIAGDAGRQWSNGIRRLAEREGTFVKLSGLPAETADRSAYEAHAADFLAVALDAFGPERAMIGSDWPVSARVGVGESPESWVERVRVAAALDAPEWDLIAGETGSRFYGLAETH